MSIACPSSKEPGPIECVTCRKCLSTCPSKVDMAEVVRLRRYLDRPRSSHRDAILLAQKIDASSEPTPWLSEELDVGRDDIYYFPGCLPLMDELVDQGNDHRRAGNAGVAVLNRLGISPKIAYGCCAHDLYYSGNLDHFEKVRERLRSSIKGKVVTGCAECYHALKELHGLDAIHISQLVAERLGELPEPSDRRKVTFHDPCRLGRYHGIYDAPREVLSKFADLREMESSREDALCCGVSAWLNCNAASKLQRVKRLHQADQTGAEVLVTACSKCRVHLNCVYREESYAGDPKKIEVKDLQEFMAESLGLRVPSSSVQSRSRGKRIAPIDENLLLAEKATPASMDSLFSCTTCERCQVSCDFAFDAVRRVEALRADAVREGLGPEQHGRIAERVKASGNVFGEPSPFSRAREGASYVYFPGCVAMFRRQSLLRDTMEVLDSLGIDYEVPEGLVCCGSVLLRTGQDASGLMERNQALLKGRKVITSCAGCYATLSRDYQGMEVMHISQLLKDKVKDLRLKDLGMKVVYHDPCHLGRKMGEYEAPRAVLSQIPGLVVKEFSSNREKARCCGGGGGVRSAKMELSSKLGSERMVEAKELEVDAIVTSCPFCEVNLSDCGAEAVDVVELVARSLREGSA